jgi:hypothetical protein
MKSKIHRCNCRETWAVQNRKTYITAKTVLLNGKWDTELKPERKGNPKGFVITNNSEEIMINPSLELLGKFSKVTKLIYDKKHVYFNVSHGEFLYFAEDGTCYILKQREPCLDNNLF